MMESETCRHNRSEEENLTERFSLLLKKDDKFRIAFLKEIYKQLILSKKTEDFRDYIFDIESENPTDEIDDEHDIKNNIRFDIKLKRTCKETRDTFYIIIENKVADIVHLKQMKNYRKYLSDKKGIIVLITRTGTFYENREELKELFDCHFYWNDIMTLLDACMVENEIIEKLNHLNCRFLEWPRCIDKFKHEPDADFPKQARSFRQPLQEIAQKVFCPENFFKNLTVPFDLSKRFKNTPNNTIGFSYFYPPKVDDKLFKQFIRPRTCYGGITSLSLWFWFGDRIYNLNDYRISFEIPSVSLQLFLPSEDRLSKYSMNFDPQVLELYNKIREEIINRFHEDANCASDMLLCKSESLIKLETANSSKEALFDSAKDWGRTVIETWRKKGLFNCIDEFWSKHQKIS